MRRRKLIAAVAGAVTLAGCSVGYHDSRGESGDETGTRSDDGQIEAPSLAEQGLLSTVCRERLKPEGIVAIGDPAFGTVDEWPDDPDGYRPMTDDRTVVGLTADGAARAYPLTVLTVHEIVNDSFGGPVLVTYCPICRSGMVADRRVDGDPATFDVSGLLWKPPRVYTAASEADGRVFSDREAGVANAGNLVMYDSRTGSYWSQMLAQAICGPQRERRLSIRPSTVTTLGEWRRHHPDTDVLVPPPASALVDPPVTE